MAPTSSLTTSTNLDGCKVGAGTRIGAFVEVRSGTRIGARCDIGSHSFIGAGVTIDDEVLVGHGVIFVAGPVATSPGARPHAMDGWSAMAAHVGRRASIGAGAVIVGDVDVGAGARISAGTVITADIEPGAVVAGNRSGVISHGP